METDLMKPELRQLWREVFDAADRALEMEPADRKAFIEQCTKENPALGAELNGLLQSATEDSALETGASAFAEPFLNEVDARDTKVATEGNGDLDGAMFGPYRVRREVGWGGMGAVYLAERSDAQFKKEVALKVLPRWSGGDQRRLNRFLEERQILATLDHPGIARLLDGGVTAEGLPWFAMEYIDGENIDKYADKRRLTIEDRLKLFSDVCAAVQYAHRNLVVHRDLKPSNILVDLDGRVALLDFGIARLIADERATETAAVTTTDRLLTPLYSSPEQIRGEPASTSADVYALGVLLHLLLTGVNPYHLTSFDSFDVARAVIEDEPERPSVSIAREGKPLAGGTKEESADERARARSGSPAKLARRLAGDLDAIVLKAMSKDPARRYATVEQLGTDVCRHLSGLPVLAQPERKTYLIRKFIGRHRAGVGMAVAAVILVLSFAAVMTVQRSRIRAQSQRIAIERDRARKTAEGFLGIFGKVAPDARGTNGRDILDSATSRIGEKMVPDPAERARLMIAMASAYERLDLHDKARTLLESALVIRRNLQPKSEVDIAEALDLLGGVLVSQGNTVRADSVYAEELLLRRTATALVGLSHVRRLERRLPDAERFAREAVEISETRGAEGRAQLARSTSALAAALDDEGNHSAASALYERALALTRKTYSEETPEVAAAVFNLASSLHRTGNHTLADSLIGYGLALNQRLLTAAILRGTAGSASGSANSVDVNATLRRAFAEKSVVATKPTTPVAFDSKIAFVTDRDGPDAAGNLGNQEVYVMNPDGTHQQRLTHEKGLDYAPSISPDGSRIAFVSERAGGAEIFVMNADGTNQRQLTHFVPLGLGAADPSWSPDGKRIVFRNRVNGLGIYIMNSDGSGVIKLTEEEKGGIAPTWSHDGRKIAFSRKGDIYTMAADGSNSVQLTFTPARDNEAAWSPDSRRIAFVSDRDGNREIYVMNADGSNQTRLTVDPAEDGNPAWSPDGRQIVFHRRVLGHGQVYVMNADGSNVRRITDLSPDSFSGFPDWGRVSR